MVGTSNDTHSTNLDKVEVRDLNLLVPTGMIKSRKADEQLSLKSSSHKQVVKDAIRFKMRVFDKYYSFETD